VALGRAAGPRCDAPVGYQGLALADPFLRPRSIAARPGAHACTPAPRERGDVRFERAELRAGARASICNVRIFTDLTS